MRLLKSVVGQFMAILVVFKIISRNFSSILLEKLFAFQHFFSLVYGFKASFSLNGTIPTLQAVVTACWEGKCGDGDKRRA